MLKRVMCITGCFFLCLAKVDAQGLVDKIDTIDKTVAEKVDNTMTAITTDKPSTYEKNHKKQRKLAENPYGIAFYRPTYILPFYYTQRPDYTAYQHNTPDNQVVQRQEFKYQLSFMVPVVTDVFDHPDTDVDVAYTQVSYWQVYAKSQYFRETNYEPELFLSLHPKINWFIHTGVDHQSNGRGGEFERSWNRAYADLIFTRDNWYFSVKPWVLIFPSESSNLHNPDIRHYMGNGQFRAAYKIGENELSVMSRNNLQSAFHRGAEEIDYSHALYKNFNVYVQLFSGYGQSLIEYNHYTNSVGVGIAFNNWL